MKNIQIKGQFFTGLDYKLAKQDDLNNKIFSENGSSLIVKLNIENEIGVGLVTINDTDYFAMGRNIDGDFKIYFLDGREIFSINVYNCDNNKNAVILESFTYRNNYREKHCVNASVELFFDKDNELLDRNFAMILFDVDKGTYDYVSKILCSNDFMNSFVKYKDAVESDSLKEYYGEGKLPVYDIATKVCGITLDYLKSNGYVFSEDMLDEEFALDEYQEEWVYSLIKEEILKCNKSLSPDLIDYITNSIYYAIFEKLSFDSAIGLTLFQTLSIDPMFAYFAEETQQELLIYSLKDYSNNDNDKIVNILDKFKDLISENEEEIEDKLENWAKTVDISPDGFLNICQCFDNFSSLVADNDDNVDDTYKELISVLYAPESRGGIQPYCNIIA